MTEPLDAVIATPFGKIVIAEYRGQLAIEMFASNQASSAIKIEQASNLPLLESACQQIIAYLQNPAFTFSLQITARGTEFQQKVWRAISAIPSGQTLSYGQLARQIGSGPRAVANACGANALPLVIPCHRVVGQNGIGGFMQGKANGLKIKEWLLRHESAPGFTSE